MVKVAMEVHSGAARFRVAVRAESIQRAVSLMGNRFPGSEVIMGFPINPEGPLIEASATRTFEFEQPRDLAA